MKLSSYKYQPLNILDLISSLRIAIFCLFLKATEYSINHLKLMTCHHFSKAVIIKVRFSGQQHYLEACQFSVLSGIRVLTSPPAA